MPFIYPSYRYRSYLHPMVYNNPMIYGGMGMGMSMPLNLGMGMGMGMGMPYPVPTAIPVPIANPIPVSVPIPIPASAPVYGGHGGYGMTAPPLQYQASPSHHSHHSHLSPPAPHSITNNTHHHHHHPTSNNQLQRNTSRTSQHSHHSAHLHSQIPNSPSGSDPRRISIKIRPWPLSMNDSGGNNGRVVVPVYERVAPAPNHNCR